MTAIRILHTADIHLGLTFGDYPEEISKLLTEARFEVVEKLVEKANQERCNLFVVGGDLFDTTRVSKKIVVRAAKILSQFEGVTLVLPGNHDYITHQPEEIWAQFQESKSDRVRILGRGESVSLVPYGLEAVVYPAPCQSRHSKTHSIGWIESAHRDPEIKFHIGLAHGSFESLTPDLEGEYFPMKRDELLKCKLDLWLMGHIHLQYPVRLGAGDRIFYPGTPEPDGFDCRHAGTAWLLEIGEDKRVLAKQIATGKYRFLHEELCLESLQDLDRFAERHPPSSAQGLLLKLKLKGDLPREEFHEFPAKLKQIEGRFLRLVPDFTELKIRLTPGEIRREFPEGSFALRLMDALSQSPSDNEALRIAYELVRDLKSEAE